MRGNSAAGTTTARAKMRTRTVRSKGLRGFDAHINDPARAGRAQRLAPSRHNRSVLQDSQSGTAVDAAKKWNTILHEDGEQRRD